MGMTRTQEQFKAEWLRCYMEIQDANNIDAEKIWEDYKQKITIKMITGKAPLAVAQMVAEIVNRENAEK